MYNRQNSIYNSAKNFAQTAVLYTGLAGILAGTSIGVSGCGGSKRTQTVEVPGKPPIPNGQPTLDALAANYTIGVGQTLIVPLTGTDDFSPGANVSGVITPTQPLGLQALPGTTDSRFTVTKLTETIANPQRVATGNATYVSPANDTPGARSYVVQLTDGDLSAVRVLNITVQAAPVPPGGSSGGPGTSVLGGGSSGGAGTGNP